MAVRRLASSLTALVAASVCLAADAFPADTRFRLAPGEQLIAPAGPALPASLTALDSRYDTLHFDRDNQTGGGLSGGGWFRAGVRFTPPFRCIIKSVLFYQWDRAVPGHVFRYGPGTSTTPGPLWDSTLYYPLFEPGDWVHTGMPVERFIPAGSDFWAAVEFASAPGTYPIGLDAGPLVPYRNFLYWTDVLGWVHLAEIGMNRNFNIRAVVMRAESRDVLPDAVIEPAAQTWPRPTSPRIRVRNIGEHPAGSIPVTVRLDSAGTRVYDRTVVLSGPIAPRQYGIAELPEWHPGPVGSEYRLTAITGMADDENRTNDTLRIDILVTGAAFTDTVRVQRIHHNPPIIDGVVEPDEWHDAPVYDVSDLAGRGLTPRPPGSALIRFLYDETCLYLAAEFPTISRRQDGDHIALCIDQDRSGNWNRADSSEGRHTALYAGADSVIFEALLSTLPYIWRLPGQSPGALSASSTAGDRLQFEAKIPFGTRRGELAISPGDTAGLFLYSMADHGATYYGWWPQHVTSGNWANPAGYAPMIFEPAVGLADRPEAVPRSALAVRPNPARGSARLDYALPGPGPATISIYDISGRKILRRPVSPDSRSSLALDLNTIPAGVYLVRLTAAGKPVATTRLTRLD